MNIYFLRQKRLQEPLSVIARRSIGHPDNGEQITEKPLPAHLKAWEFL